MGRPKAEFPRSERLIVRLTVAEMESVRVSAESAGQRVADFVRMRCGLDPAVVVRVESREVRRWNPGGSGGEQASAGSRGGSGAGDRGARDEAGSSPVSSAPADSPGPGPAAPPAVRDRRMVQTAAGPLPRANLPGLWWCPVALCQQLSFSGGLCSVHGTKLVKRS